GQVRSQEVLLGQPLREVGHSAGPVGLAALHGAGGSLGVERGRGEQHPVHVAVGREVHAAGADTVAQVLARVRVGDRSDDPVETASLHQVLGDRVEQAGARPEDQVDGGAGDAGRPCDLLDADRLRRRCTQPLVDRVENMTAGLLRRLRPQPLLVLPGAHRRPSYISIDTESVERHTVFWNTFCPTKRCFQMGTREVLVAGAGPAGLTAAIALARHGVPTLLVERRRDLSSLPRATVVSTRSMEIFRSWGLEERIRAGGPDVEWLLWACETLADAAAGSGHAVGYPTREQAAVLSPTGPACVPQDYLEPVLLAHLHALPSAKVVLGTEVVDVLDGLDAVRVTLRDAAT